MVGREVVTDEDFQGDIFAQGEVHDIILLNGTEKFGIRSFFKT